MKNFIGSTLCRSILLAVTMGMTAMLAISCNPDPNPELSVTPSAREITFSADGQKAFSGENEITPQFTVGTNQDTWNIAVDPADSWVKITETDNGFTISAEESADTDDRGPVTVTVTAGKLSEVIKVTRKGAEKPVKSVVLALTVYNSNDYREYAAYWKDGDVVTLKDGARTNRIMTYGQDIYVAGNIEADDLSIPAYWKNGQQIDLPYGNADGAGTVAITLGGEDIYVAGQENGGSSAPLYWKNGELAGRMNVTQDIIVYDMAVSGGDVYVVATEYDWYTDMPLAVYWKNGQRVTISDSDQSAAVGIEIENGDVYIVGGIVQDYENVEMGYWKNNQFNLIWEITENIYAEPTAMTVSDGDVYISGYIEEEVDNSFAIAVYWKNDTLVELTDGTFDAVACDIVVDGEDVYVCGFIVKGGKSIAVYWKNGEMFEISNTGNAEATGIALF